MVVVGVVFLWDIDPLPAVPLFVVHVVVIAAGVVVVVDNIWALGGVNDGGEVIERYTGGYVRMRRGITICLVLALSANCCCRRNLLLLV